MTTTMREQVFQAWAPDWARWSRWAKPVLFAHMADAPVVGDDERDARPVSSHTPPT
jgi:hypothetical protein